MKRVAIPLSLLCAASPLAAFAQSTGIPLVPGPVQTVQLPASGLSTSWVEDVPAGAKHMRLELQASNPARDVDLVLRKGSPFDLRIEGAGDVDQLFDQAHYRSVSSAGDEFIVVSDVNAVPLAPGRWHIGVLNFESSPIDARLSVRFANEPIPEQPNARATSAVGLTPPHALLSAATPERRWANSVVKPRGRPHDCSRSSSSRGCR